MPVKSRWCLCSPTVKHGDSSSPCRLHYIFFTLANTKPSLVCYASPFLIYNFHFKFLPFMFFKHNLPNNSEKVVVIHKTLNNVQEQLPISYILCQNNQPFLLSMLHHLTSTSTSIRITVVQNPKQNQTKSCTPINWGRPHETCLSIELCQEQLVYLDLVKLISPLNHNI